MEVLNSLTRIFKALSDESRIRMVNLLNTKKGLCVCEIREVIGLAQPTISSHLKLLENSGLVTYIKDGQWVNYSLNTAIDANIMQIINQAILILAESGQIKTDLEKLKAVNRKDICR